jgi:hypothetical protein
MHSPASDKVHEVPWRTEANGVIVV